MNKLKNNQTAFSPAGIQNPLALSNEARVYRRAAKSPPCFDTVASPDLLSTNGVGVSARPRSLDARGFTIMELLVVMAISAILMVLVLGPVVQSFKLTRQAQAMVDSQDAARMALAAISRELGQAMLVYDNAQAQITPADFLITDGLPPGAGPDTAETPIMLPVTQPGPTGPTTQWFVLPNAMINFILPKIYMHCNNPAHPNGKPRDYPRDRVIVNGTTKRTELRGWPECNYCQQAGLKSDDVEARPKTPLEQSGTIVRYFLALRYNDLGLAVRTPVPNAGWVSPWGKNVITGTENSVVLYRAEFSLYDPNLFPKSEPDTGKRLLDPYFFYRTGDGANGRPIYENWMRVARVVGIGKYEDLVTAIHQRDASGNDLDNILSVEPTITFRSAKVENDTFNPAYSIDKMNDYPTEMLTPTVFSGTYGYWTPDFQVHVMRDNFSESPPSGIDYYTRMDGGELVVAKHLPGETSDPVEFNIKQYLANGYVPPDGTKPPLEMAFTIDPNRGAVNFALQPPRPPKKSPSGPVCEFEAVDINGDFRDDYAIDRGGAIRWYWLNTFALTSPSTPRFPDQYLKNARIVPGSEKVIGPNMTVGRDFGKPVRYERVPLALGDPGINQYKIDYELGKLFFSRDPSLDLPTVDPIGSLIKVYYLVYFNKKDRGDVVQGDYLTKSLINVHIGMRMFDPDSGKAFPVDLSDSVKVRNAIR